MFETNDGSFNMQVLQEIIGSDQGQLGGVRRTCGLSTNSRLSTINIIAEYDPDAKTRNPPRQGPTSPSPAAVRGVSGSTSHTSSRLEDLKGQPVYSQMLTVFYWRLETA